MELSQAITELGYLEKILIDNLLNLIQLGLYKLASSRMKYKNVNGFIKKSSTFSQTFMAIRLKRIYLHMGLNFHLPILSIISVEFFPNFSHRKHNYFGIILVSLKWLLLKQQLLEQFYSENMEYLLLTQQRHQMVAFMIISLKKIQLSIPLNGSLRAQKLDRLCLSTKKF